jgi:hypothetical protein
VILMVLNRFIQHNSHYFAVYMHIHLFFLVDYTLCIAYPQIPQIMSEAPGAVAEELKDLDAAILKSTSLANNCARLLDKWIPTDQHALWEGVYVNVCDGFGAHRSDLLQSCLILQ